VADCQDLFRRMAESPLMKLWIEQQLWRHRLTPALVWKAVGASPTPTTVGGLRTLSTPPHPGGAAPWQVS
jgi:hypothetical protein